MLSRSRIRSIAKWSGVAVCVALGAAWGATEFWSIVYLHGKSGMFIAGGDLAIDWRTVPYPRQGWSLESPGLPARMWARLMVSVHDAGPIRSAIRVPLYHPLLLTALSTAYLFYRDGRYPPGHCQRCGYNLKGNVSGVCPECGLAQPADERMVTCHE